ncbi:hypothetical protein RRG08_019193 [Elysia crispata]|uniref:Uncharacterized protein n=1 Tax=Elysia crispata TaxID=231223 RepID=A0AAE1E4U6_9GAST|nr:hypothetical protein RRG08_019193 [Elysia crispata]
MKVSTILFLGACLFGQNIRGFSLYLVFTYFPASLDPSLDLCSTSQLSVLSASILGLHVLQFHPWSSRPPVPSLVLTSSSSILGPHVLQFHPWPSRPPVPSLVLTSSSSILGPHVLQFHPWSSRSPVPSLVLTSSSSILGPHVLRFHHLFAPLPALQTRSEERLKSLSVSSSPSVRILSVSTDQDSQPSLDHRLECRASVPEVVYVI